MYSVYIIQSELDKSYYIGSCEDKNSRIWEHNYGRTKYTKSKRPWKLLYYEEYDFRGKAVKREKYLKKLKSKIYLEKLINKSRSLMGP